MGDHVESIVAAITFPILMNIDMTDEVLHFAFSFGGSILSGLCVFFIKRYLEKNWDKIFKTKK